MANQRSRTIDQAVSSDFIKQDKFKELFSDQLLHQDTRIYVEKIIKDYTGKVDFMKVVQGYAGTEIDNRLFKSVKFWGSVILTTLVTYFVTYFLIHYLPTKTP